MRLCAGGFGIFGHGNVTCLGEALEQHREELPLWRGQNEQSMAMAAIGYTKQKLRQRFMFATTSAGPGTTNMLTSAGIAHTNRLPLLMLCGDAFATRLPDPVLQQVEHFGDPTISVNDAFKSVTRYWDRISHPAQLVQSLPRAIETLLDPADCGPAFLGLPQDVQGWAYDYPLAFFEETTHRIRRQMPDEREVDDAAALIRTAERPVIIAGGGVQYSRAVSELTEFATGLGIPVIETIAGRANLVYENPLNCGPVGVTGSNSANALASEGRCHYRHWHEIAGFHHRFPGRHSRATQRSSASTRPRHDAGKHRSLPVVGDAKLSIKALAKHLSGFQAPQGWRDRAVRGTQQMGCLSRREHQFGQRRGHQPADVPMHR